MARIACEAGAAISPESRASHQPVAAATTDGGVQGWWMGANYLITAAYIDFLEGSGRARVVTRGKVLVKNGQAGTISVSDQVVHFAVAPQPADGFGIVKNYLIEKEIVHIVTDRYFPVLRVSQVREVSSTVHPCLEAKRLCLDCDELLPARDEILSARDP